MAATSELDRVTMVVLRYLRRPVFALIMVYAIGIIGMALIPGADGETSCPSMFGSMPNCLNNASCCAGGRFWNIRICSWEIC